MTSGKLTFLTSLGTGYAAVSGAQDMTTNQGGMPLTAIIGLVTVILQVVLSFKQKKVIEEKAVQKAKVKRTRKPKPATDTIKQVDNEQPLINLN